MIKQKKTITRAKEIYDYIQNKDSFTINEI